MSQTYMVWCGLGLEEEPNIQGLGWDAVSTCMVYVERVSQHIGCT